MATVSSAVSVLLPAVPAWAEAFVRVSAPQYEAPGGTVPTIVTMVGIPSGTTSVSITARGTNGSSVACAGPVWINRGRGTASRTCYLTLPRVTGSYNVVGTATATRSGASPVTRTGAGSRAVLANGPLSNNPVSLGTIGAVERCHNPGPGVWLTFDDGASATQLSNILSTLSRNNVRGHFFFTGAWRDSNPVLYRRLLDSGHYVSNHSYNHPALSKLSDADVSSQIRRGIAATTSPKLIRPPFGAGALTSRLQALAAAQGYRVCRWTVDTFDWDSASPAQMRERVVTGDYRSPPVAAGGNILMHGKALHTSLGGLQAVIDGVRSRGLRMLPLRSATPQPAAPSSSPGTVGTSAAWARQAPAI